MSQRLKLFGPPGTGKTSTLLDFFEQELKSVRPDRIAFLTFTRAARLEALGRSGRSENDLPYLKTIHSICYRQMGLLAQQMIRPKRLREFGETIGAKITGNVRNAWDSDESILWERPTPADQLLQLNHVGRHRQIKLREAIKRADHEIEYRYAKWFTEAYRRWKTLNGLVDFTDLLTMYLESGNPLNVDVLFVDEAQDLSLLQWAVVERLGANAQRVYLAGDDDQAVFAWAGADAVKFIDYKVDEERVLGESHRLPRAMHRLARVISSRIRTRRDKVFQPRDAEGEYKPVGRLESSILSFSGDTFILYRNHFRGRQLAEELEEISYPYLGERSVLSDPTVSSALHGWQNALKRQPLTSAQARAIVECSTRTWINREAIKRRDRAMISPDDLFIRQPKPEDWHQMLIRMPGKEYVARCVRFHGWDATVKPKIHLMSIHQSKGREAETVILDTEMTRRTYDGWVVDPDDEHRCWYVAVTRAKERLLTLLPEGDLVYHL